MSTVSRPTDSVAIGPWHIVRWLLVLPGALGALLGSYALARLAFLLTGGWDEWLIEILFTNYLAGFVAGFAAVAAARSIAPWGRKATACVVMVAVVALGAGALWYLFGRPEYWVRSIPESAGYACGSVSCFLGNRLFPE
jgi:hypothetical protein